MKVGDWMPYVCLALVFLLILAIWFAARKPGKKRNRYDSRGFDHNGMHRNGTKYDDQGFDFYGYDSDGYDRYGYNRVGRNRAGEYDRYFDSTSCAEEGFCNPRIYPVAVSKHAAERFEERFGIRDHQKMLSRAKVAYSQGKSARQIKKTSAYLVEEIQEKYDNSIVLIYHNVIYIFTNHNCLKTLFPNDRIPL